MSVGIDAEEVYHLLDTVTDFVIRQMRQELGNHLRGILLTGSRATQSDDAWSDWDFIVVHDKLWRQRRLQVWNHQEIELFLNPAERIMREFHDDNSPTVWMFVHGQILFDPEGIVKNLTQMAQCQWNSPRRGFGEGEIDLWRYRVCDMVKDVAGCIEKSPLTTMYLIPLCMQLAIEGYYKFHQWWQPKSKYILTDFIKRQPELGRLAETILLDPLEPAARMTLLTSFVEQILKPAGGCLVQWASPVEIIRDP